MKKRVAAFSAAALISVSGLSGCGMVQDAAQDRANEEIEKGKTKVEQRVNQEKSKAVDKVKEKVKNQGGG